jgi:hypothetical protein
MFGLQQLPTWIWILGALIFLPGVTALSDKSGFPDLPFAVFSNFIQENFAAEVTLSQVLLVLFTLTENPDLLNLHARQKNPRYNGETRYSLSGWIKCLARGLEEKLGQDKNKLFHNEFENIGTMSEDDITKGISRKIDAMANVLDLSPYNSQGRFKGKLKPISYSSIEAVYVICPNSFVCETTSCNPRSLLQNTKPRDIPRATLIKGTSIHKNVQVLTGSCPICQTLYVADHERVREPNDEYSRVYLNSAKYLKVGQSLWVDRVFSHAVVNGMYSFHASTSAYTDFWNKSFSNIDPENSKVISARQIWKAFVGESVRTIAGVSGINLILKDGLGIDHVTRGAFMLLGEDGIIHAAKEHSCAECTQPYKHTADTISDLDTAAAVNVDEVDEVTNAIPVDNITDDAMDIDYAPVKMIVMDGIVMGTTVSAITYIYMLC